MYFLHPNVQCCKWVYNILSGCGSTDDSSRIIYLASECYCCQTYSSRCYPDASFFSCKSPLSRAQWLVQCGGMAVAHLEHRRETKVHQQTSWCDCVTGTAEMTLNILQRANIKDCACLKEMIGEVLYAGLPTRGASVAHQCRNQRCVSIRCLNELLVFWLQMAHLGCHALLKSDLEVKILFPVPDNVLGTVNWCTVETVN